MKVQFFGFIAAALIVVPMGANATPILGFNGVYDVSTWTTTFATTTSPSAVLGTGGSVDTSGAPNMITLTEPDNGGGFEYGVQFTNVAAADGIFSFDWTYDGTDGCCSAVYAYIGSTVTPETFLGPYLANGVDIPTGGSFSAAILAGQVFGWGNFTEDDIFGANVLTITNFSAPGPVAVPEPGTFALLGLSLAGLAATRRRKQVGELGRTKTNN